MNINFSPISGMKEVKELIQALPRGVKHAFMLAFAEYIVGDENHGLKHEPSQKTHDESNPYKWTSAKQRSAFFASDGFGQGIPTKRTHETAGSWTVKTTDSSWTHVGIENKSKGAPWVFGEQQQVGHAADGWRYYWDIVMTNVSGATIKGLAAVNKILKAVGGK